ncbi:YolD-like family protein [Staphylococcus canis]|uniref:YolD-like family protein n=1 Tax=Staphylococcus canis TaxID=2724942 RepID=A0ABS0TDX0_9STAP|nr:YolD-like family protein [Staphylococcus canis]MBI5975964.1 YolD-like family protein [Staphylococcus canis]
MINPDAPDPYKYETDYRKIPRQYLNPRIPNGRGIVKWAPFATLPEQFEAIKQFEKNQLKIEKPTLSEAQMQDINYILHIKLARNEFTTIHYWRNGHIHKIQGYISKVDPINHTLILTNARRTDRLTIDLTELYQVE